MVPVDGGVVLRTVLDVTVVVAVVAGSVEADGAAPGGGGASFDGQPPRATMTSAEALTTRRRLTT